MRGWSVTTACSSDEFAEAARWSRHLCGKSYGAAVHLAEDVSRSSPSTTGFVRKDLSAPVIHHADLEAGFLVTEDFGTDVVIEGEPRRR
jgi:aminoglycoside/choline kinase family phosphotransferase